GQALLSAGQALLSAGQALLSAGQAMLSAGQALLSAGQSYYAAAVNASKTPSAELGCFLGSLRRKPHLVAFSLLMLSQRIRCDTFTVHSRCQKGTLQSPKHES
nr:hypothetical protein [Saprospiraceae bacterium]